MTKKGCRQDAYRTAQENRQKGTSVSRLRMREAYLRRKMPLHHPSFQSQMEEIEQEATVVRKSDTAAQTGESDHYRVYCYFTSTPVRNFELFYVELDARSSNATIGHSKKAQEYIYVIDGELVLQTELGEHALSAGDAMTFDSSVAHIYVNQRDEMLKLVIINFYPSTVA